MKLRPDSMGNIPWCEVPAGTMWAYTGRNLTAAPSQRFPEVLPINTLVIANAPSEHRRRDRTVTVIITYSNGTSQLLSYTVGDAGPFNLIERDDCAIFLP